MTLWLLFTVFLISMREEIVTSTCNLNWAPTYTRSKVFISFLNKPHCPTWMTKNNRNNDPTGQGSVAIPKGVPFAFFCGSCYQHSILKTNLTAETDNGTPLTLVPIKDGQNEREHRAPRRNYLSCLLSYGLTAPVTKSGKIFCRLNRGKRVTEEAISFTVREEVVPREEEEEERLVDSSGQARLQCPIIPTPPGQVSTETLVHVWHHEGDAPDVEIVRPSVESEILHRPKANPDRIICTTYDFLDPKNARSQPYKVLGGVPAEYNGYAADGGGAGASASRSRIGSKAQIFIVSGVLLAGIGVATLVACASFGLCRCKKERRIEAESPKAEPNRVALLPHHHNRLHHHNSGQGVDRDN